MGDHGFRFYEAYSKKHCYTLINKDINSEIMKNK